MLLRLRREIWIGEAPVANDGGEVIQYAVMGAGSDSIILRNKWKTGDGTIIDGIGPDGVAARVIDITNRVVKLQSGYIYHYAYVMLVGVALIITYFIFAGGGLKP